MVQKSIREFGMFIDKAVYGVVSWLMQLIMDLSNVEIFNESIIDEFASRIYIILGLVMLFKIMISFIQMLINPDKMSDKEQGAGNILKRVVISLALIFLVPSIFDLARQVQGEIIPIIPKVVLGVNVEGDNSETWTSVGRTMAFYSFSPFFGYQNPECAKSCTIIGTCSDDGKAEIYDVPSASSFVVATDNCSTDKNGFMYSYSWPLSTLVGAYLVYVLVSIAVSVAIRAIKLSVCELVAPIPIASYIDPKSSKQTFDKWVSTTLKTYADLFIRLIIVYFVVFVLQTLLDSDVGIVEQILANVGNDNFRKSLVVLFIIVGLLQFAKQAPKFIGDMLGFSGAGDFMGMFKGEGWKQIGNSFGGLAGMATAPLSSALSNYNYARIKGEKRGRALARALGGAVSGGVRSTSAAFGGKGWKGAYDDTRKTTIANSMRRVNTRRLRLDDKARYNEERESIGQLGAISKQIKSHQEAYENAVKARDSVAMQYERQQIKDLKNMHAAEEKRVRDQLANIAAPAGSVRARLSDTWKDFSGTPIATSKTYHQAASLMNSGKSKIFNAAKTKVVEKPNMIRDDITLKDADGNTLADANGNSKVKFNEIFDAYENYKNGHPVDSKFANFSRSELETIYGNALKDAAAHYVNHVVSGGIENVTMKQDIEQWQMKFDNDTIISSSDRKDVTDRIQSKGYGGFFKSSDDIGARYETQAMRMETTEKAKKGDSGGGKS